MKKVTGIGGVFFKSKSPKDVMAWYRDHLGFDVSEWGGATFEWRDKDNPERVGQTLFTAFKEDTKKFEPATGSYMLNLHVADLPALLAQLRKDGVEIVGDMQDSEYGKFAWVMDPEGRKIELWQPPDA